jgi:hypothetical protein
MTRREPPSRLNLVPLDRRPSLDRHDFDTVRQLYTEAQQWARHYEMLVVNGNVFLVSASLVVVGFAFESNSKRLGGAALFVAAGAMAAIGFLLTQMLFRLYAQTIRRMIRLENLLNCYSQELLSEYRETLLDRSLMQWPVSRPTSVRFFVALHAALFVLYFVASVVVIT